MFMQQVLVHVDLIISFITIYMASFTTAEIGRDQVMLGPGTQISFTDPFRTDQLRQIRSFQFLQVWFHFPYAPLFPLLLLPLG